MLRYLGLVLVLLTLPVAAQIVTASETFRIVEVDRDNRRIGIASMDADPDVRQNWINLKDSTQVVLDGENPVTQSTALASLKKGDVIRVHGGRTWTGKISAKSITVLKAGESQP